MIRNLYPMSERFRQHRVHQRTRPLRTCRPLLAAAIVSMVLLSTSSAWAQAADPSDIVEGGKLFRQKASCQSCHGWAGDGRKMDNQMPDGANLRESTLTGRIWS